MLVAVWGGLSEGMGYGIARIRRLKEPEAGAALLPEQGSRGYMRVLVVGSGAREHALCWAIAASPSCDALFCAPGNAGIAAVAECRKVAAMDFDGLMALSRNERIDFVVIGP